MEAPDMVTFDGETFQAAGPWLPAPEIAQYVRIEVMDALAARLAEVERERDALADGLRRTEENRDNAMQDAQEEYDRAVAAEARLAEVERERDRMEAEAVVAMDRWHQSQARVERLATALNEIDALDPEHLIDGYSQTATRGLVLRMGEIARAARQQEGGE
jgi:chromosome segregation ATPase